MFRTWPRSRKMRLPDLRTRSGKLNSFSYAAVPEYYLMLSSARFDQSSNFSNRMDCGPPQRGLNRTIHGPDSSKLDE